MIPEAPELLSVCRAAMPDREGLTVRSINPMPGKHHTVVAFQLIEGETRTPLILRRYPSPLGWAALDDPHKARREFEVLRWLAGKELPAPEPVAMGHDSDGDWLLEKTISGRHWWLPLGSINFKKALPALVRQQVRLIGRLHSLELDDLPIDAAHLPTITVRGVIEMTYRTLKKSGDSHLLAAIERISGLMRGVKERPPKLLHLNVEMENVLVDETGEITGWLSWDQAALGDPRWDVAVLVNSLYGGYHLPDLAAWAVDHYGRETVRPIKDIALWAALIAVLRWGQCSWLADQMRQHRAVSFPSCTRFLEAYSSHRAWAIQLLNEAEKDA
jgi:aminoglycoside phosphotransferase (APT) family kinase protein